MLRDIEIPVRGAVVRAWCDGAGPPLLLLHGYPQTRWMWRSILDELAAEYTVIATDLRGYGRSQVRDGDMSFRAMALDQVAVMAALGHSRFHVVGHDRGARVAHRLALDHPGDVLSVALLDILPTVDTWDLMDATLAMRYYHWTFLAQGGGLPQRLIGADPVGFLHDALSGLSGPRALFDPRALADYEDAARRPSVVASWCADYAAAAGIDLEHDRADLGRIVDIPALVLWGSDGALETLGNPLTVWRRWFPQVRGGALRAGHFLVEERPEETLSWLSNHLAEAHSSTS